MFYSPSLNAWFDPQYRADYEKAGTWPSDAVEYPREVFDDVVSNRPPNKVMLPDADGRPTLQDPPPLTAAAIWETIKAERDRRTEYGGVLVDGRWFDTDMKSAVRYKMLADAAFAQGAAKNAVLREGWRPMDVEAKGEVAMTYDLLLKIIAAGIAQAFAIDDAAEVHKAAMEACPDPSSYDFSSGWPTAFGD